MQISNQEVDRILRQESRVRKGLADPQVNTVDDLAAKHGISMEEVRRFTERALTSEEDPARERRVRELQRRIAQGTYQVDGDQVVDMAERRAIADRSRNL